MADAANFKLKTVNQTPQAQDDHLATLENMLASFLIDDLMANDKGGNGKSFYGIDQTDPRIPSTTATTELGATITVVDGVVQYDSAGSSALQALGNGETAIDSFTYTIRMGKGVLSTATVSITVTGTNDAPVIVDAETNASGYLTEIADGAAGENATTHVSAGSIAFADLDTTDVHSAIVTAQAGGYLGTLTLGAVDQGANNVGWTFEVADGAIDFLAEGETRVQYYDVEISDGEGGTAVQTIAVTLTGTNDAPVVTSAIDNGAVVEDGTASAGGTIAFTDVDLIDGHYVGLTPNEDGYTGTFSVAMADAATGDGAGAVNWSYTIDNDFAQRLGAGEVVTQSYTVTVYDTQGGTVDQTVTVTITGTNDAPVITGGDTGGAVVEAEVVAGIPASATPIMNDAEANDDRSLAQQIDRAALRVAPNANLGDAGDPSMTIIGEIHSPADNDWYAIELEAGEILTLDVDFAAGQGLDSHLFLYDADGNLLIDNDDAPRSTGGGGSAFVQDSFVQYVAERAGTYYIKVQDFDGFGQFSAGVYSLQVSVDSQGMQLTDSGALTFADVDLIDVHGVTVIPADSGYLGELQASVSDASTGDGAGTVSWHFAVENSAVQYLAVGETLTQNYTVQVDDGQGGSASEVVTVTITGTNDLPILAAVATTEIYNEDAATATTGTIGFADVDLADAHSVSFTPVDDGYVGEFQVSIADDSTGDGVGQIAWSFSADNGALQYLGEGQSLLQRYVITVDDGNGGTAQQLLNITITGGNDTPVAVADEGAVDADQSLSGNVLANDSDIDANDMLSVASVRSGDTSASAGTALQGAYGTLTVNPDGSYSYTPDGTNPDVYRLPLGDTIEESFTYTATDQFGATVEAELTVTVIGVNTTPEAGDDFAAATEDAGAIFGNVGTNDVDPDYGAVLSYALDDAAPAGFALGADGAWSFDPSNAAYQHLGAGQTMDVAIPYTVTDEKGASDGASLTITVTGTNDGPVASNDVAGTSENSPILIDVLANDSDVDDGASLSLVSVSTGAGQGSVSIEDNQLRFDPGTDFDGLAQGETAQVSIAYTIADEHGAQSTATVDLTVTGTNDAPTVAPVALSGSSTGGTGSLGVVLSGYYGNTAGQVIDQLVDSNGDGLVDAIGSASTLAMSSSYSRYGIASGDLDADGDVDVVISSDVGLTTFTNRGDMDGDGRDDYTASQVSSFQAQDVALADLDGDGRLDIASVSYGQMTELLNRGDVNNDGIANDFALRTISGGQSQTVYGIDAGDLNGDGRIDIINASWSNGPTEIRYNLGDTNGDGQIDYLIHTLEDAFDEISLGVDTADLDGDGDLDIVLSRWNNQNEVVYLNDGDQNGDGKLEFTSIEIPSGGYTMESQIADIDGDGDLDIVGSELNGTVRIIQNRGDSNGDGRVDFTVHHVPGGSSNSYGVAVIDMDGDGDLDIFTPSLAVNDARYLSNLGDTDGDGVPNFASAVLSGSTPSWDAEPILTGGVTAVGVREDGPAVSAAFAGDDIDSDDNQASLTYVMTSSPAEGSVTNNGDGTFSFDPGADFQDLAAGETREVSFEYHAVDAHGAVSNSETVTVTVAGTNDGPTIIASSTTATGAVTEHVDGDASENASSHNASGSIAFADLDASDTHSATVTPVAGGYRGALTLGAVDPDTGTVGWSFDVADGALDDLAAGEVLTQNYVVAVSDDNGGVVSQTVTVTLTGSNDAPEAGNITLLANRLGNGGFDAAPDFSGWNVSTATSGTIGSPYTQVYVDRSGNAMAGDDAVAVLNFSATVPNPFGTGYGPSISSTPFAGAAGDVVRFTYRLTSGGDHALGFGYIRDAATNAIVQTIFNYNTGFTGSTGDQTVDLTLASSGNYVIEFRVGSYDATGGHAIGAQMNLGFAGIMRNGVSEDGSFTFGGVTGQILATASDVDGDALTASLTSATSTLGAAVTLNADGSLLYDAAGALDHLARGEEATDTVSFTIDDGHGGSTVATATVTVVGENDAPDVSGPATANATEGAAAVSIDALANASDVDNGATLTVVDVPTGLPAGVSFNAATGQWTLDPAHAAYQALGPGQTQTVTVNYGVSDGFATTAASASWTITGTNEAPVAVADIADMAAGIHQPLSFTVPANSFADPDGGTLSYSATMASGDPLPSWLSFNPATRAFSGTPTGADAGNLEILVTASDGFAAASQSFTIAIDPDQRLVGTNGGDTIGGDIGDDTIIGNNGDDVLSGGAGNDIIWGDAENAPGADPSEPSPLTAVAQSYYTRGASLVNGLGGSAGFGESLLNRNDDGSTGAISIQSIFGTEGIDFFGNDFTNLWVNNNGNLTFNGPLFQYVPSPISPTIAPIIAAFWTDIDTRAGNVGASPGGTSTGSNLVYWDLDTANGVFTATWDDVGEYSYGTTPNAFQIQLVDRDNGDFDILLRYETLQWDHGGARAGYSSGNGVAYELAGSGTSAALGYESSIGNTGVTGLHVFEVRGGQVLTDTDDVLNGGDGADTLAGGAGLDTFLFHAGEADGDTILDFNGEGTDAGDRLIFEGYGAGATFTQVDADSWMASSADGSTQEVIHFTNAAAINPTDIIFI